MVNEKGKKALPAGKDFMYNRGRKRRKRRCSAKKQSKEFYDKKEKSDAGYYWCNGERD